MKARSTTAYAIRLLPGQMLKEQLVLWAKENNIAAAAIVTCVGSLRKTSIRFADQIEAVSLEGKHEIISLTGTLSQHGIHLHICVADGKGAVTGGHLMTGCEIYTTAEIVIADLSGVKFSREPHPNTGWLELTISPE